MFLLGDKLRESHLGHLAGHDLLGLAIPRQQAVSAAELKAVDAELIAPPQSKSSQLSCWTTV